MRPPRFHSGSKVWHQGKLGVIVLSFPDEAGSWRYYVDRGGFRWSVPESALALAEPKFH